MPLKKELGRSPRDIAQQIVSRLDLGDVLAAPEIAGPGFINLRFKNDWLAQQVRALASDERLGVDTAAQPRTLVIDFSSPNVAKPMHVGHLRSTIIGDSLARLFRFLGHHVITDNHLGDWGTQFGMLLYGYKSFRDEQALRADPVREMVRLYVKVRKLIEPAEKVEENDRKPSDYDAEALAASQSALATVRRETAKLHAGDAENVRLWQMMMPWCLEEIDCIYRRLDVHFDHTHGESFYNPMLPDVVRSLLDNGLARESEGAIVIGDEDPPALIRKRDGAFTYTTSDLATIRYRVEQWHPDAMLYVVDSRQALHFKNLFDAAKRWGFDHVNLEHISFGSVLGPDRKPIKTREGGAVELSALLDEACERAREVFQRLVADLRERGEDVPERDSAEVTEVAGAVGIGAVKYADLSQNRTTDYVFSWEKMLAMDGNTATYMQYAYARNRSILRKSEEDEQALRSDPPKVHLDSPYERELALQLLRFPEALDAAAAEYKPNLITGYLWDLAKTYSGFNTNCRVLQAEAPELRRSRLLLCDLTARTIRQGLQLLGIRTVARM